MESYFESYKQYGTTTSQVSRQKGKHFQGHKFFAKSKD